MFHFASTHTLSFTQEQMLHCYATKTVFVDNVVAVSLATSTMYFVSVSSVWKTDFSLWFEVSSVRVWRFHLRLVRQVSRFVCHVSPWDISFFIYATLANEGIEPGPSDVAAQGRNQLLCPSAAFDLKSIRFLMLWWNISKSHKQRT